MGIFNRLGREVEQFKQTAKNAAAEDAEYRCRACDARFTAQNDRCPECGAKEVEPTESEA
ncbi:hypothetical protein [Halalkalicoccus salilacus]|uniref:hypothetical protein n=1 Tax=Halalkalicoccus TaxID=332246 RepID=UPI002F96DAF0